MGLGGWMLQEPYMLRLSGVAPTQGAIRKRITDLIGPEKTATFYEAWLANHCRKVDIDSMARWGFNSVRLPMHYNLFTPPIEEEPVAGQITWNDKGFRMVDSLLQWCRQNRLYLILDLHAAPGGQGADIAIADRDTTKPSLWQSEANKKKTVALWRKLAERYAGEAWIGGYDLINETNWGFQNPADKNGCAETENVPLRKLLQDITIAIREVDQKHLIFLEANCWANNYKGVLPLWDNNTVISFHKYWNYNDTASIKGFLDLREKHNAPIWMGESGENSNAWFTDAISLLEKNKIGWAWWPLKKLGFNNPMQIKMNKEYEAIIKYWSGEGAKPSEAEAFRGLMQLAEDTKLENTFIHKGVIDAMFRQVNTAETKPYTRHTIESNALIYAADYDMGRIGYAYHDSDYINYRVSTGKNVEWNKGRAYRNDGVDIKASTDTPTNGYVVSWLREGEWLQYTIEAKREGNFQLQLRTAMDSLPGVVDVELNGKAVQRNISLQQGDKGVWVTTTAKPIYLKKGNNKIRVRVVRGGFDFNYIRLSRSSAKHA